MHVDEKHQPVVFLFLLVELQCHRERESKTVRTSLEEDAGLGVHIAGSIG